MEFSWNSLKSERLKLTRGVSFKEILRHKIVDTIQHPRIENQRIFLINYKNYIWAVPYIRTENQYFLKTIYPSRKYTKIYQGGNYEKNKTDQV